MKKNNNKPKLLRVTTKPQALYILLENQMRFMVEAGFDVVMVSDTGTEVEQLNVREKARHVVIRLMREVSLLRDIVALIQLIILCLREKPDIVHSHTPKAGLLSMIAGRVACVPVCIHTVAGIPALSRTGVKRRFLLFFEKQTYKFAHHVYPNSNNLAKVISNEGLCKSGKLSVLGEGSSNGIDVGYFKKTKDLQLAATGLRSQYGIKICETVFVYVGRLVGDKGLNELVRVFERIQSNNQDVFLLLVGPFEPHLDPLSKRTLSIIEQNEKILTVGFQADVRPFLAAADIFVFPSHREGFPNVVMQAACMELPIIATNINGTNEIVTHGDSGLLFPVKDEEKLYDNCLLLYEDKSLREKLASNAKEAVKGKFERKYVQQCILAEYKRLLRGRFKI